MACRDTRRGEVAASEVRQTTGNGNVVVRQLDLSSLASVRQFTNKLNATEERLDILINNAGGRPSAEAIHWGQSWANS